jgi:hypothetical protein
MMTMSQSGKLKGGSFGQAITPPLKVAFNAFFDFINLHLLNTDVTHDEEVLAKIQPFKANRK